MSGFGIANAAGALTLAGVAVLIALHLYGGGGRMIPVGTLFLWRHVAAQRPARRRLRIDALFLLQLAVLLALVAAAVRPYVAGPPAPVAVDRLCLVVDVSASMQAREAGGTRFELARARARVEVAKLGDGGEVMILAAEQRARVVLRWTADRARIRDGLEALAPVDTPTDLARALELALDEAHGGPGTRVVMLTDLAPQASGLDPDALAATDWVQIGRTDDNVAIASLTIDVPPFRPAREVSATVAVRNYAHEVRRVALEATVGGEPWGRRALAIAPRQTAEVVLDDPPRTGEVVVRVDADDALPIDDQAFGWIAPETPLDVLVVTDSDALASMFRTLGATIAGSRVEAIRRARWEQTTAVDARAVVFGGMAPPPPAAGALYLAPPPGNPVCPTQVTVGGATVVDWDPDHPALAGLNGLDALSIDRANPLESPPWGTPVVFAAWRHATLPLLVAGERDGHRIACLGADLPSSPATDTLPLLLLTLSTLGWVEQAPGREPVTLQTGIPVLVGRGPTGPIGGSHGGVGLRVAGTPSVLLADRTGLYRVGPPGEERIVSANLFDDRESDIGREGSREWVATAAAASASRAGPVYELGWWFCLGAAGLLWAEWLLWAWRRR